MEPSAGGHRAAVTARPTADQMARCPHTPQCPGTDAADFESARVVVSHPLQGWSLLCNGAVVFEDTGAVLPDGRCLEPHRPGGRRAPAHDRARKAVRILWAEMSGAR